MNNKKDKKSYKYKLVEKKMKDIERDYRDSGRENMWVLVEGKPNKGLYKPVLGYRKKDYSRPKISSSEYGEFIAYKLANKIGIPVCEAEFVLKKMNLKYSRSKKTALLPGSISYIDLVGNEELVQALQIITRFGTEYKDDYQKIIKSKVKSIKSSDLRLNPGIEANNNNIDIIMPAFESYAKEKCGISDSEWYELRQNIINMIVFDLKFANRDRNDENYGLAVNYNSGKLRLYPIFDNEYILGFCEFKSDIEKLKKRGMQTHIRNEITSRMGNSHKVTGVQYQVMLRYLFDKYPEETQKAYEKVMQIEREDLVNLMEECEGLPDIHKEYALEIFDERQQGFMEIKSRVDSEKSKREYR